ncbi:MAG: hypothetical protein HRU46_04715 [Verrucomicrobiales bacterium]|nr:hypothetical protein [Verrucomicrobiales bacterium]
MIDLSSEFLELKGPAWLLVLLGKTVVIVAFTFLVQLLVRNLSAANRHAIWLVCFASLAVVLVVSSGLSQWRLEIESGWLPIRKGNIAETHRSNTGSEPASQHETVEGSDSRKPVYPAPIEPPQDATNSTEPSTTIPVAGNPSPNQLATALPSPEERSLSLIGHLVIWLWLLGAILLIAYQSAGYLVLLKRFRNRHSGAAPLLDTLDPDTINRLNRSKAEVRSHPQVRIPFTFGFVRPQLLLPEDWSHWSLEKQKFVFCHELAHIERRDFIASFFCRFIASLLWMNPLVWLALRQAAQLREQACDDAVIRETNRSSEYAKVLTSVIRSSRATALPNSAVGMAAGFDLEQRIAGIIAPGRNRNRVARWLLPTGIGSACLALLLGLSWLTDGRAEVTDPGTSEEENSPFADYLTDFERNQLGAILENVALQRERLEKGLHYTGTWTGGVLRSDTNQWEELPIAIEFEVWMKSDTTAPRFRTDYRPNVVQWIDGSSPWSIVDETEFSDGNSVLQLLHESPAEVESYRKSPSEAFSTVPGFGLLVHAGATWGSRYRHERGKNSLEFSANLMSTRPERNPGDHPLRFELRQEEVAGVTGIGLTSRADTRTETWWLDPQKGYALVGRDLEVTGEGLNGTARGFRFRSRILEMREIEDGFWFPVRGEFLLERFDQDGVVKQWDRHYEFQTATYLSDLPDTFFEKQQVVAALEMNREEGNNTKEEPPTAEENAPAKLSASGIVLDEAGDPVEGVEIQFRKVSGRSMSNSKKATTGPDGRWTLPVSRAFIDNVSVKLSHPDFASDSYFYNFRERALQPYEALLDGSATLVIRSGVRMSGRIIGHDGEPVENAEVMVVRDRHGSNFPNARTDKEGYYEIQSLDLRRAQWKQLYVTVLAANQGPVMRTLDYDVDDPSIEADFVMPKPQTFRLRIVDRKGRPLSGVAVYADRWREETRTLDFAASTNNEGRIVWRNAPDDEVRFDILSRQQTLRRVPMTASTEEVVLVLEPALEVTASVNDKKTGRPVNNFRVTMGRNSSPGRGLTYWESRTAEDCIDGTFSRKEDTIGFEYFYRIEAPGYEAFETVGTIADRNQLALDVQLTPK